MSRRRIVILAFCALIIASTAFLYWTLASGGPERVLAQQLRKDYGLELSIGGQTTIALLPSPRVKIEDVQITNNDGTLSIKNATLRGKIGFFKLLFGRIELQDLSLSGANTVLDMREKEDVLLENWPDWLLARTNALPVKHFSVSKSTFTVLRKAHPNIILEAVNFTLELPKNETLLTLTGRADWNGKTITVSKTGLRLSAFLKGKKSELTFEIETKDSRFKLAGNIQIDRSGGIILDGHSAFKTSSLSKFSEWTNLQIPLSPFIELFSMEGDFSTTKNLISWPSIRLLIGTNAFEGSMAFRLGKDDNTLSGTLATDELDLTNHAGPWATLFTSLDNPLTLKQFGKVETDIRLSASIVKARQFKFSNLALGLMLKPERIEISLGKISLDRGTLKGKMVMTEDHAQREIKLQGAVENVDLARLFQDFGFGVSGATRAQFQAEGKGASLNEMLRSSKGKATLSITNGELRGLDIPLLFKMSDGNGTAQPLTMSKTDMTSFMAATIGINLEQGIGSVTDGSITMKGVTATLSGNVSLESEAIALNMLVSGANSDQGRQVMISAHGGWNAPTIVQRVRTSSTP